MAVSGLIVTLSDDAAAQAAALLSLRRDARVELGLRSGAKVALVLETEGAARDDEAFEALRDTPGVVHVDLVYVEVPLADVPSSDPCAQSGPYAAGVMRTVLASRSER